MAREATITFEQVAAIADEMKTRSQRPTARSIREALGTGSMATILKLFQQWQGTQARQSQVIDETLDPAIARAIGNHLSAKVQIAIAETSGRLADLQAEAEIIIAENERQSAEIESQANELATLQEQHTALVGRTQQLEADAQRTTNELVAERRAAELARVELAKAELRLEAVPRIEAEIEKVRTELGQERTKSAELHEAAAVATAKLEAEITQRKSSESHLAESLAQSRAEAKRALEEAAELRGKLGIKSK